MTSCKFICHNLHKINISNISKTLKDTLHEVKNDEEIGKKATEILRSIAYSSHAKISNEVVFTSEKRENFKSAINLLKSYSIINGDIEQDICIC